jgi:signal transduction histidine kinase
MSTSAVSQDETLLTELLPGAPGLRRESDVRARQQEVVAQLGLSAIVANTVQDVLELAVRAAVETLGVGFAKVLELAPDGESFLLRAGVGWRPGLTGTARFPVGESQGGFTLKAGAPVIVEDLREETRLLPPRLLVEHGVVSGMTVLIRTQSGPWGVFGIHSSEPRRFTRDDVHFLQALANVVTAVLERERYEDELRRSRAELDLRVADERLRRSERLASLGTLAAGIAHEINNPVNTILMTAESALLASEEGRSNGRLGEDLSIIVQEAHRCGEIVERVLEFVRDRNLGRESEDVNDVVHSAVTLAETTLRDPVVPAVEVDLVPELPRVHLNRAEMEQVLLHLIRNAAESGAGEPVSTVVRTRRCDHRVVLTVEDDGRGIPPEVRDRIFDPFFTTRREQGGTGLGLALAHSIVTDHGGTLDVESEPGEGAVFRIELPIAGAAG